MIRLHRDAIIARLSSDSALTGAVFRGGEVPETPPDRYIVVWLNQGLRGDGRETGKSVRSTFTTTIHWVGETEEQALWLAEKGFSLLLDWNMPVTNRNCWPLQHMASVPVALDKEMLPVKWRGVDQFDFTSDPS